MHELVKHLKTETIKLLNSPITLTKIQIIYFYSIIVEMAKKNIYRTKREIYYMAVTLFKDQKLIDRLTNKLIKEFPKAILSIKASFKGLYCGKVDFVTKERIIKSNNKISLIPDISEIKEILCYHKYCIVIEKESLFNYLVNFNKIEECLFVTGKGYPCKNTIDFLKRIKIPIYGLFDFDPFGLNIYLNYKKHVNIERIGLNSEDVLFNNEINSDLPMNNELSFSKEKKSQLILLNEYDYRMIKSLEKRAPELKDDILFLKGLGKKIELEAMFTVDTNFYEKYIKNKIKIN